ncbi:MAG: hypothetical protein AMJ73_06975 [candidate division Zixibacteria bacterium SM1_73]|nr:MAG: hypothetical protein AMJ73_06975 [candidate division Zixibacteria bacterium SM1_73]
MQKVLINQYKRQDVFQCGHKAHFKFEKNVSVYHVLKEKRCYPEGCVYFLWKCKLLNKGHSCPKRYQHVGRNCFSCKNYFEEKITYQPEILLNKEEIEDFQRELEEFEDWLQSVVGKRIEFSGTLNSVKPHFKKKRFGSKEILNFPGFLISFKEGYLDRIFFKDHIFLTISRKTQENLKFAKGDKVEFEAFLRTDKGRIILEKARYVEFLEKRKEAFWNLSQAIVAKNTGTEFDCQPEKCLVCEQGCLLDVIEKEGQHSKTYRHLFCLAGVTDPENCVYHLAKKIKMVKT